MAKIKTGPSYLKILPAEVNMNNILIAPPEIEKTWETEKNDEGGKQKEKRRKGSKKQGDATGALDILTLSVGKTFFTHFV